MYFYQYNSVINNDRAFRRKKTLLTPARSPLGVTVNTADGVVFTKVTTGARKYDSYEPPDPGLASSDDSDSDGSGDGGDHAAKAASSCTYSTEEATINANGMGSSSESPSSQKNMILVR